MTGLGRQSVMVNSASRVLHAQVGPGLGGGKGSQPGRQQLADNVKNKLSRGAATHGALAVAQLIDK